MAFLQHTERRVARALAEAADPGDALSQALATIGACLSWPVGAVWEPDLDDPARLRCIELWHVPGLDAGEFERASRELSLAAGEGLPGRVWSSGEPAWLSDLLTAENFPRTDAAARSGLRAAFAFPMTSARGVLGVIEFLNDEPLEPDAELLATMSSVGQQIGQTLLRRRDAQELRAKEARHEAMLNSALDAVVTMDHEGRVIDFNPAAERTFGYRAGEVIGQDMAELIVPPALRRRHRRGLSRYLATEEGSILDRRLEITGMRADGSEFPVELTITRIDLPGSPLFTGYLRDITERQAADRELRASRTRIVEAADAARRRLERDLHDGAQQRLVELALDLRMARSKLEADDPDETRALIDAALEDLAAATRELRELARGIHPAALAEGGLRPALEGLVSRSSVPASLRVAPERRFAAAIEATVYFTVAEALTNTARYAGAERVEVEASVADGRLRVTVRDDGRGGADPAGGSGLRGLADRLAALNGSLEVTSRPNAGTMLVAEMPCES